MFGSCSHMGLLFEPQHTFPSHPSFPFFLWVHFYTRTCIKYLSQLSLAAILGLILFSPKGRDLVKLHSFISHPSPSVSLCSPSIPADIDECQVHNGGCQQRCVNTRGSYYCECHPGSRLHVDGRTCLGEEHHSFFWHRSCCTSSNNAANIPEYDLI